MGALWSVTSNTLRCDLVAPWIAKQPSAGNKLKHCCTDNSRIPEMLALTKPCKNELCYPNSASWLCLFCPRKSRVLLGPVGTSRAVVTSEAFVRLFVARLFTMLAIQYRYVFIGTWASDNNRATRKFAATMKAHIFKGYQKRLSITERAVHFRPSLFLGMRLCHLFSVTRGRCRYWKTFSVSIRVANASFTVRSVCHGPILKRLKTPVPSVRDLLRRQTALD